MHGSTGLRRTVGTVSGHEHDRPWWKTLPARLAATVAVAAIGWLVVEMLDEGRASLEPPLRIAVESDPARVYAPTDPGWEAYGFVARRGPSQLGRPPSQLCREWRRWALAGGGVDADQTRLYAFLQGKPNTAVVVTDVDVEVTRRRPALAGTHAQCTPAGGASPSPRLIDVDLDTSPAAVRYANPGDEYPARRRLLLTLDGTETETLQITAHTRRCDCEWQMRVEMRVNGRRADAVIDDGGEPFRTSTSRRSAHVTWDGRHWTTMSRDEWKATLPLRSVALRDTGENRSGSRRGNGSTDGR